MDSKIPEPKLSFKQKYQKFVKSIKDLQFNPEENKRIQYTITDDEIEEFKKTKFKELHNFDKVGYARPLGGYFYQFFFAILGGVVLFALYGSILEVVYPYPTAKGYIDGCMVLFSFVQFLFNIPTGFAIERFISEWRIKNPLKMLEYIRFYIWYQMTTGLILVSSISIYILTMLSSSSGLEYAKWLMLILIIREYPAMLDIFFSCIKGLQQFHFESQIYFSRDIITKGLEIAFTIGGRLWGEQIPEIGGMMGLAIGWAIGTYIDDFINMFISCLYFNKVLKNMGFRLKDVIVPHFGKDVIKTSILYGIQVSWPGIVTTLTGMFMFFAWYQLVPAYLTLKTLNTTADELANITKRSEGINLKGGLSESYNNGKIHLTQYYVGQTFKWYGFFTTGIGIVLITFFPALMEVIFSGHELQVYMLAIPFILPNVLHTVLVEGLEGEVKQILNMTNHQMFNSIMDVCHHFANLFITYFYLFIAMLPQRYGIAAMIWILPMGTFPADFGFMMIRWWYVNKNVFPVKVPYWQAFIAPLIPGGIVFVVGRLWIATVHQMLINSVGSAIAGIATVAFGVIGCFLFMYITLYSYFGGWDDYGLATFYEAVKISGPSRIFFVPIAKLTGLLVKISPLHNKFPIPWKEAEREAFELMIVRERNDMAKKQKAEAEQKK